MKRHDEGNGAVRMPQTDVVSAALTHSYPAKLSKGRDQLCAGDDWEAPAQPGNVSLRWTTPVSRDRPCSRIPST
jgi:hypothetical protein